MNATAILEKPMVIGFQASVKDGIIEIPIEYRNSFLEPVFVEIRVKNETAIDRPLGPITRQLAGIINAKENLNHKELLAEALSEKYL